MGYYQECRENLKNRNLDKVAKMNDNVFYNLTFGVNNHTKGYHGASYESDVAFMMIQDERIEEKLLRVLINFCSTNAIKTYIFLKWKCRENGCIISRKEICENIGLSANSKRQLQEITDITKGLQKLGLINRKTTTEISVDGEDYNRSTYYELVPFEKWEEYWESEENPNKR